MILSLCRLVLHPRSVHVGFVMNKMALGQALLCSEYFCSLPSASFYPCSVLIQLLPSYNLSSWQCHIKHTHTHHASHWINYIRIRANNGFLYIIILNPACSKEITFKPLTAIRSSFISSLNCNCFFVEKFFSNILRCSLWNSVSTSFERHSLISSKTPVKKVTFFLNNTVKSLN